MRQGRMYTRTYFEDYYMDIQVVVVGRSYYYYTTAGIGRGVV
jgi:hypothetical protein